jgi:hypothetical protein
MTNDAPEADPYQGPWWTRLRRAFGIPDLVGNECALKVIAHDVAQQSQANDIPRVAVALAVVWALLTMGERGDLDVLFFDEARQAPLENPNVLSIDERIKRLATERARTPESGSAGEWQKMIVFLRTKVVDHVRLWPYEAGVVHYLPAHDPPAGC